MKLETSVYDELDSNLIEALNNMNEDAFKNLILKLMDLMGLDIINSIFKDQWVKIEAKIGEGIKGAKFPWYLIMIERNTDKITPERVQEFVSEKKNRSVGLIYISTAGFSPDALRYAREFDVETADESALSAMIRKFELIDDVLIYREKEILDGELGRFLPSIDELENIMEMGEIAFDSGDLEDALSHYTKASDMKPNYDTAWYKRGLVLNEMKEHEEALKCYMEALEIDTENAQVWFAMGVALFPLKRYREEIECYEKAIELDPDFLSALNNKGATLLHIGRYKKASKTYDEILKIDPNFKLAWNNKGFALKKMNNIEEALECFINAINIDSRYLDAWMNRGLIYFKQKRYKVAYHCFECVLQIDKDHIQALYHKARTLEKLDQFSQALGIYQRILELDPKFYQAKRRMKKAKELKKKKKERKLDDGFFKLSEEEKKEYLVTPKPLEERKVLVERNETKTSEAKIHNTSSVEDISDMGPDPKQQIEPPTSSEPTPSEPPSPSISLEDTRRSIPDVETLTETQNLMKMKEDLKGKENELIMMEAKLREKYFTMENEREELKHIRKSLDKKKEDIEIKMQKTQEIVSKLNKKEKELWNTERDLERTKDRLMEEQVEIERQKLELTLKVEKMSSDTSKSKDEHIALEKDLLRLNEREREIIEARESLDEESRNIEARRISLQTEMNRITTSRTELAAREKSINLREEDLTKRFDLIVERSGDIAIKEKELEEMARELKRTQENLQKKAKVLKESERRLLEKQKLLSENRATMKETGHGLPGMPYSHISGELGRGKEMNVGDKDDLKEGITKGPGGTISKRNLMRSPSLSSTLDHERFERELMIGEMQSLSDIMAMYSTNQSEMAQSRIDEAQREGLDSKLIWNIKGNILREKNEYEKALVCYNTALKRDQNYVITLANMMSLFSEMAKYQEALGLCKKILTLRPYDEKFILNKVLIEVRLEQIDEAVSTVNSLLVQNDKHDTVWNLKGILLYNLGQLEDALECFDEALKLNPDNYFALNNKGVTYYKIGKFKEALECFIDALKMVSNDTIRHNFQRTNPKAMKVLPAERVKEPEAQAVKDIPEVMESEEKLKDAPEEGVKAKRKDKETKEEMEKIKDKSERPKKKKEQSGKEEDARSEEPSQNEKGPVADMFSELSKISQTEIMEEEQAEDIQDVADEESAHEDMEVRDPGSEDNSPDLYMCPSCGSFVSIHATICEQCGYDFEEDEEVEEVEGDNEVQVPEYEEGVASAEEHKEVKDKEVKVRSHNEIIEKFKLISGVGEVKAKALFEAGFSSYDSLRNSSISDIGQVKGIGNGLAKAILDQLKKKKFSDS